VTWVVEGPKFPFKEFALNEVWLEIVTLAHDLLVWTQALVLDHDLAKAEPKRVRQASGHPAAITATQKRAEQPTTQPRKRRSPPTTTRDAARSSPVTRQHRSPATFTRLLHVPD